LESKYTFTGIEGSNPSLSAVNVVSEEEEQANCLACVGDEKGGAMSRQQSGPRAGVEKFFARRREKYS
jgi:hypothetical protein